jgi:[ribosomal protein S5]-alanine N-acetyltransferase
MLGLAFDRLDLHRVTAAIGPDNVGSLALIERVHFTYEGRLRDHVHTNGAWRDSLLYSILATDRTRAR